MTNLQAEINNSRRKMIELADKYGFTSEQTVKCSQQLDSLLNLLMMKEQERKGTWIEPSK